MFSLQSRHKVYFLPHKSLEDGAFRAERLVGEGGGVCVPIPSNIHGLWNSLFASLLNNRKKLTSSWKERVFSCPKRSTRQLRSAGEQWDANTGALGGTQIYGTLLAIRNMRLGPLNGSPDEKTWTRWNWNFGEKVSRPGICILWKFQAQ